VPAQLRGYRRAWVRDDVVAGVTVAALVVPLGLAFAELAGVPAAYGLYTSVVPVLVFAWLASTPQAVVGAEAALAGIVAAASVPLVRAGADPVDVVRWIAILVGLACVVGAVLRLGRLAQLVSRPVFAGYLSGVAVTVVMSQLPKLLGASPWSSDSFLHQLGQLPELFGSIEPAAAALGLGTVVIMVAGRELAPRAPTALAMLVLGAVLTWSLDLAARGVATIGQLPRQFPDLLPAPMPVEDVLSLVPAALVVALVGFADTTLVSQGFAARNQYRVDSTRDLAALGAADLASGVAGALPLSASSARTAVAESSGAHSQVAPAVSALGVVAAIALFADLLAWVPQPVLGGIVAAVMVGVADPATLLRLARTRRSELVVALVAFGGVLVFGVLEGVLVAIAASLLVFARRALHPHDAVLGHVDGERGWFALDEEPRAHVEPGLLVYRFDSPLFFANADVFRSRVLDACEHDPGVRHVIVEAAAITDVDYTAARVLEELAGELAARGISLAFAELHHELVARLERDGLLDALGDAVAWRTLAEAEAAWRAVRSTSARRE
jgi:high affinity sulfate transporter 1